MENMMNVLRSFALRITAVCLLAATLVAISGCERKEKVLDIETPGGEVEVDRDPETGDTDVEVNTDDDPNQINP